MRFKAAWARKIVDALSMLVIMLELKLYFATTVNSCLCCSKRCVDGNQSYFPLRVNLDKENTGKMLACLHTLEQRLQLGQCYLIS